MGPRVRGDDKRVCVLILATHCARGLQFSSALQTKGRREDRVRAAPAVSCALMHKKMRTRAYRFSGNTPAFPAQWLYDLYRALPGESEPLATIAVRKIPQGLTPAIRASGPHDFAVRDRAVRYRHFRVHRIPSRVRDDREPPLLVERDARSMPVIWGGVKFYSENRKLILLPLPLAGRGVDAPGRQALKSSAPRTESCAATR